MEHVDILDDRGRRTGKTSSKEEAHQHGYWHRAVHVWIVNSKDEALIQLRSMKIDNNPGKWDISAAGHVSAGEVALMTAVRETHEELGLDLPPEAFEHIGEIIQPSERPGYINNEFNDVFLVRKDVDPSKLVLQGIEVDAAKLVPLKTLKQMVEAGNQSLVLHLKEYKLLFDRLKI